MTYHERIATLDALLLLRDAQQRLATVDTFDAYQLVKHAADRFDDQVAKSLRQSAWAA